MVYSSSYSKESAIRIAVIAIYPQSYKLRRCMRGKGEEGDHFDSIKTKQLEPD